MAPNKKRLAIGSIRELYVPADDELSVAYQYMREQGWLDKMAGDLSLIGLNKKVLKGPPKNIINVRFKQSKVQFFDPRFILPEDHVF